VKSKRMNGEADKRPPRRSSFNRSQIPTRCDRGRRCLNPTYEVRARETMRGSASADRNRVAQQLGLPVPEVGEFIHSRQGVKRRDGFYLHPNRKRAICLDLVAQLARPHPPPPPRGGPHPQQHRPGPRPLTAYR